MSAHLLQTLLGPLLALSLSGADSIVRVDSSDSIDPIGSWMKRHNLAVRKIFDGSKEEQNPASLFLILEPTGKDHEFSSIDIAVKFAETELLSNLPSSSLILLSAVDYHRSTNSDKLQNQAGLSGRAEFRPVGLKDPNDRADNSLPGRWWPVAPTVLAEIKAAADWQKKSRMTKYSAQVFFTSLYPFGPGRPLRRRNRGYLGQYYPYVGIERYSFSGPTQDTVATVGLARLWLEYWPLTTQGWQILQLTADVTTRHRLFGDTTMPSQLSDVTIAANLYLDRYGHVGLGIDYANGRDVTAHFARRERTRLGLKIKF